MVYCYVTFRESTGNQKEHSFIRSFDPTYTSRIIVCFIHLFVYSFIHLFIYSFIRLFVH